MNTEEHIAWVRSLIIDAEEALVDLRRQREELLLRFAHERHGVAPGVEVRSQKYGRVLITKVEQGQVLAWKPHVTGRPMNSDGTWSRAERNCWSDWQLAGAS